MIIVLTFASWLYARHRKSKSGKYPIKILQDVPRGFKHIGQPVIDPELVTALASGKQQCIQGSPNSDSLYRIASRDDHSFPGTHCYL